MVVAASQEAAVVVVIDGGIGADLRVLKLIPDELDVGHYVDDVNVGNAIHRDRKFWRSLNIAELSTGRPWMGRVQPYGRRTLYTPDGLQWLVVLLLPLLDVYR